MARKGWAITIAAALFLLSFAGRCAAENTAPSEPFRSVPDVSKVEADIYRLGAVEVDAKKHTIKVPAKVNMQKGLVELLACTPKGKRHESVLVIDVDPLYLQLALLLLGLEPGGNPSCPEGEKEKPGGMVRMWVEWKEPDGRVVVQPAENLVLDVKRQAPMERTPWVFIGSRTYQGSFLAQEVGTLVATYHDPTAILENPLKSCNDDTVYEANPQVCPPTGTRVTLMIKPAAEEGEK